MQLPCILETHKTYDDNLFYKSGEIGQVILGIQAAVSGEACFLCTHVGMMAMLEQAFVVTEKDDERAQLEQAEEVPNGITPPNTNVVKRKYEKTKRYAPFPVCMNPVECP